MKDATGYVSHKLEDFKIGQTVRFLGWGWEVANWMHDYHAEVIKINRKRVRVRLLGRSDEVIVNAKPNQLRILEG